MKIKLNILYIQNLTNNEAFTYFCTLVTIANNPDATIKDVVRTCGIGETTVFKHLKKFDELGYLDIDRTGTYNTYSYTEPDRLYITIDSDLLNINGNKNQLGALIRLKSYTRIGTNIVDLSLNRIVHEVSIQHDSIYFALENEILERNDKKTYFTFIHPAFTHIW